MKRQRKTRFVVFDRYSATGKPRPNPRTVCRGKCEGMGFYPVRGRVHGGWKMVRCGACRGTGLRPR